MRLDTTTILKARNLKSYILTNTKDLTLRPHSKTSLLILLFIMCVLTVDLYHCNVGELPLCWRVTVTFKSYRYVGELPLRWRVTVTLESYRYVKF